MSEVLKAVSVRGKDMSATGRPPTEAAPPGEGEHWVPPLPSPAEILIGTGAGVGAALSIPLSRPRLLRALRGLRPRAAAGVGSATRFADPDDHDPGWFGPDSVAWRIHDSGSMLVAGITAFALQMLHPLALAGVADHSSFAEDFMGRTQRTGEFVTGVVYGTSAEAEARCAQVQRIHRRVVGLAPDGRPYSADDPDLLEWVHLTEYMAIAAAARRYGLDPPDRQDLDTYVAETARVGLEMGVEHPPRSWAEMERAFQRFRPQLALGEQGVAAKRFLQSPPGMDGTAGAVWRTLWGGAIACMHPVAVDLLQLTPPSALERARCRAVVQAMSAILGPSPAHLAALARCR